MHQAARSGPGRETVAEAPQDPELSARGKRGLPLRFGGCISRVLAGQGASQGCLRPLSKLRRWLPQAHRLERPWGRAGHLQRAGLPVGRSGRGDALAGAALGGSPGRPVPRGLSPPRAQGVSACCSALRFSHQPGTELQARRREGLGAGMPSACRGQALRVCLACWGLSGVPPRCRAPRLSNRATPSVLRN